MRASLSIAWLFAALPAYLHALPTQTLKNSTQIDLGYAKYEGTALSNGVNQFLGMRYAAAPTGDRRFRLPQTPLNETGIIDAKEHGPLCYGVISDQNIPGSYSEDCLFIDVYAPANASRHANRGLPVMLWIQGGAFVELINPNYNGTGLIEASGGDVIVVTFNYRIGALGFLASDELAKEGNLNIGLHDQRAAIRWVTQHISKFGGDSDQVTLFGTSIGGGSILMQLLAYGGESPQQEALKWSDGIASAIYLPSVYDIDQLDFHYDDLKRATNCTSLDCLRSAPIETLQAANKARPFPGQTTDALFGYGPVIDGNLIPARPRELLRQGHFLKDKPLIMGSSHFEGTIFAPQANIMQDVDSFVKTQFPRLTNSTLRRLEHLYKDTPSTYSGATTQEAPLYYRAAEMYGDASFACPTLTFAEGLSRSGVPVHLFLDRIQDPVELAAGFITPHTWELGAVWGPQYSTQYVALSGANSYEPGEANADIVPLVQGYWTSFAESLGDPNKHRSAGSPIWQDFSTGRFLNLQTNNTKMERVDKDRYEKCAFWSSIAHEILQ